MFVLSVAFLFGAATINLWHSLWGSQFLIACALLSLCLLRAKRLMLKCVATFLIGIVLTQIAAYRLPWFDARYYQQRVTVESDGIIASVPEKQDRSIRFLFKTPEGLFYLNWYGAYHSMKPGQRWHLRLRLIPVKNYHNETGFDLTRWLMLQGVHAKGYVLYNKQNRLIGDEDYRAAPLMRYRYETQRRLKRMQIPHWEVISALTLGLRNAMSDEYWQLLRKTNTSHLLAISGLHIGMISGMIFFIFQHLWRQSVWLTNWIPAPIAASYPALVAAFAYALIAGWSLPTQRAFIMIAVGLTALMRRKPVFTWRGLSLALWIVIVMQPLSVMTIGFALSFLAAFSLIYVLSQRKRLNWIWLRTQWSVTLFLFPWILLFFKELALVGWLVNFIAIPFVSLLILPSALIGVFVPIGQQYVLHACSMMISVLMKLLALFADLPTLLWYNPPHSNWILACAVLGLLIVLLPRGVPGKYFGVLMILPALVQGPERIEKGEAYVQFLDVHHGLAVVIQTKTHAMLYDIGDPFITKSVLLPFLEQQGIRVLDKIVISHPDYDHLGALNTLLYFYPQVTLESSEDLYAQQPTQHCAAGQTWQWDGVSFTYKHPSKPYFDKQNDNSCVLEIKTAERSLLLTGDISKRAERKIADRLGQQTILQIPHHGSSTSSSIKLLKQTQPLVAILSTHRPQSELKLERYNDRLATIWSTYEHGQINIKLMPQNYLIEGYRQLAGALWYDSSVEF